MALVVNTNTSSMIAQRNLSSATSAMQDSIEKLSSGYSINKASDDAAGLSISEGLEAQIRGNSRACDNIQDGINMLQIAEGALTTIGDSVQRIRELCVQAANGTNGENEKAAILSEINARMTDIDRISRSTAFNGLDLFSANNEATLDDTGADNTDATPLELQIGANSDTSINVLDVSDVLGRADVSHIGFGLSTGEGIGSAGSDTNIVDSMFINGKLQIDTDDETDGFQHEDATGANWDSDQILFFLDKVDDTITNISSRRSEIGAYQNRLESALSNLTVTNENVTAAQSRIRDVDIADETANMTKFQILQQASASVLKQANSIPQLALSLLS